MDLDYARSTSDQTTKRPTLLGWPFCLQIKDLREFRVERMMGVEPNGHFSQKAICERTQLSVTTVVLQSPSSPPEA
jgi:hypothetical protein